MRKLCVIILFAVSATLYFQWQSIAETAKSANGAESSSERALSGKPKPEDVLRRMADYLGNLPAFACRIEATLEIKDAGDDVRQVTKMTARLQRPNRLALILDEGETGLTVVSDGKQLSQYLPLIKRYAISDVPSDYQQMTDVGVKLKLNILGSTGGLIPVAGKEYFNRLIADVTASDYIGTEKVGDVLCHHLRFVREEFDWEIWIEAGKRPIVHKVALNLSKQVPDDKASVRYTIVFSDWDVSPKFKDADFVFTPPADAKLVDYLVEPEPPHPLLGKPAPTFTAVDLEGQPVDLKTHLGKDVVLLDFWSTSCGPCVKLMPQLNTVAKKFGDKVVYWAINGGEDVTTIKEFLAITKLKAPIVMDPELAIWQAYRVSPIPQVALIGKDGKVQVVHLGYNDVLATLISNQIDDLLAGKDLAGEELAKGRKPKKRGNVADATEKTAPAKEDEAAK